nr:putative reverse transcriptase domain-containing protein [Tanacetum cinerariifolium]
MIKPFQPIPRVNDNNPMSLAYTTTTISTVKRLTKPLDEPEREFRRLRKAAMRSHQNESLAIAGRNLFDDEASSSNNTGAKLPMPPKTLHDHSHPNSGRLKRACKQIAFLETPTREVGIENPYLICNYCGGSHKADECEQNNPPEQVCLSGGDIYNDPSLLRFYHNDDTSPWGTSNVRKRERMASNGLLEEKLEKAASSIKLSGECSAIIQRSLPQMEEDSVDFVVLEMDKDELVQIILGRPFLATTRAVIDVHEGKLSLKVGSETITFNIRKSMKSKHSHDDYLYCADHIVKLVQEQWVNKELPEHLEYAFLQEINQLPVVISSALSIDQKTRLLEVLQNHKGVIAWSIAESKELTHPFVLIKSSWKTSSNQASNLKDALTPITKSPWVSPVQVVPKKGGMTVVKNEKDELIPQRTVTGWRVCIDYRKLNKATRKYHFPLSFIDQMLERIAGHEYYCFLDGFSGYFQILIAPEDQEKTTFTCPYGTFAYKQMPFGLCNASVTFNAA